MAEQPPVAEPLVLGDTRQTAVAWVQFFQSMADQNFSDDARLDACEARLAVGEARLLSIETRLAAAGIP